MNYTKLINDTVAQVTAYAKQEGWVKANWKCDVKVDTSARRTRSWGGTRCGMPFISLAVNHVIACGELVEYRSFAKDPVIGTVSGNASKAIVALVLHEMAHSFQFSGSTKAMAGSSTLALHDTSAHGELWKKIYRELREKFCNSVDFGVTSVEVPVATLVQTTMTRQQAQSFIHRAFLRGERAPKIIEQLVVKGMKKTTASTYTYEVKRLGGF